MVRSTSLCNFEAICALERGSKRKLPCRKKGEDQLSAAAPSAERPPRRHSSSIARILGDTLYSLLWPQRAVRAGRAPVCGSVAPAYLPAEAAICLAAVMTWQHEVEAVQSGEERLSGGPRPPP